MRMSEQNYVEQIRRFRVMSFKDAKTQGLRGLGLWNDCGRALYDFGVDPPALIATDDMQPEDVNFYRDLEWVPELLNQLHDRAEAAERALKARTVERDEWQRLA